MNAPPKRILIVEDNRLYARAITQKLQAALNVVCDTAASAAAAGKQIAAAPAPYDVAVLDLMLPDAPDGEIVDAVIAHQIPTIVLTGDISDDTREKILSKNVVDYLIKEGPSCLDQLVRIIHRIIQHSGTKVIVADDSKLSREHIRNILETQGYDVLLAASGREALALLEKHPDTKLVITDYHMAEMNGDALTVHIRTRFPLDRLAIIGISAHGNALLSARFLKNGANDFLTKPFSNEELFWRVHQNIELQAQIELLKKHSVEDPLTGLYNRRYFFDVGEKLIANAKRRNLQLTVALFDIDHFKKINDTYGHMAGDQVLRHIGLILRDSFRSSDIICRFGGEAFCVLAANMNPRETFFHFEQIRSYIERHPTKASGAEVPATVSVGVSTSVADTLEATVAAADALLYQAKKNGRNQVAVV